MNARTLRIPQRGRARNSPKGRGTRALRNGLAAIGARGFTMLTGMISVPLVVTYLGPERYGVWVTLIAFMALMSSTDLGIGNGLLNAVSEAYASGDRRAAKSYVSSALLSLGFISVLLGALFLASYSFISWSTVMNVQTPKAEAEVGPAIAVFVICFLFTLPLSVISRSQIGVQDGFLNSLWTSVGSVIGLLGVSVAIFLRAGLPWLVLALAGGPLLAQVVNGLYLFGRRYPWMRPSLSSVTTHAIKRVFSSGAMFLVLQISYLAAFQADVIIVGQIKGPEQAGILSVSMRAFNFIPVLVGLGLASLWPAYSEAISRGDMQWVARTFRFSITAIAFIATINAICVYLLGQKIVDIWTGGTMHPSHNLVLTISVCSVCVALANTTSTLMNSNPTMVHVLCWFTMSVTNVVTSILFTMWIGTEGVVLGSIVSLITCILIPYFFVIPKMINAISTPS